MIIPIEPDERKGRDDSSDIGRPEKGFLVVGTVPHPSPSRDAIRQARARSHRDFVPNGTALESGAGADGGVSEHAVDGVESGPEPSRENAPAGVDRPGLGGEGPTPLERFERRAEKIARSAEVGVAVGVEDETDLVAALGQERLPEIGDERRLTRRNPIEEAGSKDAHSGVHQGPGVAGPEARDAVPFGLKRRVPVGVSVFSHQQGRCSTGGSVPGAELGVVRSDGGIGVDHQKVVIASSQERGRVAQSARRAEQDRLAEKRELWRSRRLLAQAALDLIAQVMEIHRHLAQAGLLKPLEVGHRDGNVEKR